MNEETKKDAEIAATDRFPFTTQLTKLDKEVARSAFIEGVAWHASHTAKEVALERETFLNEHAENVRLHTKLEILREALAFECGDRCAHQNPCNAKEALEATKDE